MYLLFIILIFKIKKYEKENCILLIFFYNVKYFVWDVRLCVLFKMILNMD